MTEQDSKYYHQLSELRLFLKKSTEEWEEKYSYIVGENVKLCNENADLRQEVADLKERSRQTFDEDVRTMHAALEAVRALRARAAAKEGS
jgi:regulator of replication initiation timing